MDERPRPEWVQAFVQKLPCSDPVEVSFLLLFRQAYPEKGVQKAIRKAAYRLRQRGISVPETDSRDDIPAVRLTADREEPKAHAGPIDGTGSRGLFVALPRTARGLDVGMGVLNDEKGILDFIGGTYSKNQLREIRPRFFESFGPMVEIPLDHAADLLESVRGLAETDASRAYLSFRPLLLESIPSEKKTALSDLFHIEEGALESLTPSRAEDLLAHDLFESWVLGPEETAPVVEEIFEAEESPIYISEEQKAQRIQEIRDRAVKDLFPDEKRGRIKKRLEEMAIFFSLRQEKDYAQWAFTAALSLEKTDSALTVNPFLKCLTDRYLDFYIEAVNDQKKDATPPSDDSPSGLILT
jgi:hypothetical protein